MRNLNYIIPIRTFIALYRNILPQPYLLKLFLAKWIYWRCYLVWNWRHINSSWILGNCFIRQGFKLLLLCVLRLICVLHILSSIWIYYLACSHIWFGVNTCIHSILPIFSTSNCTFSFSFWFRNLRIVTDQCSMDSIRS